MEKGQIATQMFVAGKSTDIIGRNMIKPKRLGAIAAEVCEKT